MGIVLSSVAGGPILPILVEEFLYFHRGVSLKSILVVLVLLVSHLVSFIRLALLDVFRDFFTVISDID